MGKNQAETRTDQRKSVKVFINYRTIDQFFSEMGTNLSTGGVFIRSKDPLPVGTEIRISFNIPQFGCYLESMGVVVHNGTAENPGMGIKFKNLSERAKRLLNDVLEHELLAADPCSDLNKSKHPTKGKKGVTVRVESRSSIKSKKLVKSKRRASKKGSLNKKKKSLKR